MFYQVSYCYDCCKDTGHYNGKCGDCEAAKRERLHREHFAKLDSMTLEERVRAIEKSLYEMSINPPWVEPRY